jgi:hypothetical protein
VVRRFPWIVAVEMLEVLTGSGAVEGIGDGQRVRTPLLSVHAKRFWVGEKARCVIMAVEEDVYLY